MAGDGTERFEAYAFAVACGAVALHAWIDVLTGLEPGVEAGERWLGAAAISVTTGTAALAFGRSRAGIRGALALAIGVFCGVGATVSIVGAAVEGVEPSSMSGVLLVGACIASVAIGSRVLWRSRKARGHPYLRRTVLALGGLLFVFEVVFPISFAWVATHRPAEAPRAVDLGRAHEEVALTTDDGLRRAGSYAPSRNGAAVVTFPSREGTAAEARMLAANGFGVLALDMRGYGASEGDPNAFGWGSTSDIDAAVAFLSERPEVRRIGGLGLSVGGEQMLEAASENPRLRAVVSEGAGERSVRETLLFGPAAALTIPQQGVLTAAVAIFGGEPPPPALDDVARSISPRAIFLIRGAEGQAGEELNSDYYEAAAEPKEIWTVPGAGHTGGLEAEPEKYERRVTAFFERELAVKRRR
jgi:fermentation-respiration switch protein FrsA (DUF1100 family)